MRLIDADAFWNELQELESWLYNDCTYDCLNRKLVVDLAQVERLIEETPTVERPRGEWIKTFRCKGEDINTGTILSLYYYDCPKCKYRTGNQGKEFYFCPNCGADMRGEGE